MEPQSEQHPPWHSLRDTAQDACPVIIGLCSRCAMQWVVTAVDGIRLHDINSGGFQLVRVGSKMLQPGRQPQDRLAKKKLAGQSLECEEVGYPSSVGNNSLHKWIFQCLLQRLLEKPRQKTVGNKTPCQKRDTSEILGIVEPSSIFKFEWLLPCLKSARHQIKIVWC